MSNDPLSRKITASSRVATIRTLMEVMRRALLPLVLVLVVAPLCRALLWHDLAIVPLCQTAGLLAADAPIKTSQAATLSTDPNDWPTYNRDFLGTRHNPAEQALSRDNVGQLVEKWRFPPADSDEKVGVVHATVVVNGYVYFGTETNPTFYKLTPDGKVKWAYRPPPRPLLARLTAAAGLPTAGFMNAALVTGDTVYVGDMGGTIYALDRMTGQERWKIDTRAAPFPCAHPSNCVFSAPILAEGCVVVAGGAYEHAVGASPLSRGCTGRGFVVALVPDSGKVAWKYDVGPEPGPLDPPVTIKHSRGEKTFYFGPSTSSVWCTPSFDTQSHTVFFGTDCHNSPRQPTLDDPRLSTKHSCAVIAVDSLTGAEKWVTQITSDDVWNYALPAYDPQTGKYKDQSVGDTPKIYSIDIDGNPTKVVGCGTKNGGFYVLDAASGQILANTPIYTGPPSASPEGLHPRTLALPSAIGGLQTGCATDGHAIFTNGIDFLGASSSGSDRKPTGGRVVSISLDTRQENWRHERPKVKAIGGTTEKPAFTNVGDPVGSGIALANGVAYFTTTVSNKLVALDISTGAMLNEIDLGPVWCGPVVSRGRVYVGTGNLLFSPENPQEAYFPKSPTGAVRSFGLPGDDEITRLKSGDE
jgi:polyvinyl alcohol dehydrogenase (cytochrome)